MKKIWYSFLCFIMSFAYGMLQVPAEEDTLTRIQFPLINIPVIALPGDTLLIEIDLPQSESVQYLSLIYKQHEYELPFVEISSASPYGLRVIQAVTPSSMLYGLYDLSLHCSDINDPVDISEQAVYIIPGYKNEYTFVHVTDTHLPSHYYWGDPDVAIDSTELEDFRAVIEDINIIHPEFVLHTGDLINDGELEALGVPAISRAKRILHELDVPLFMVSGNHDLGGWDATPAPDGTARQTWWKFFGWKYLDNLNAGAVITQDYSFRYGNAHFIGLESYVNYDGWRNSLYGYKGFLSSQLQWLDQVLSEYSTADLKVLFYHYDFEYDLNLSDLGVDAAFWGHNHRNTGDMSEYPYGISTASTCDGNRWYRIVKVQDNTIVEMETVQAGSYGETINKIVNAEGSMVRITNNTGMDLQNCLVTFSLEEGKKLRSLNNALLLQIDTLNSPHTVYAYVDVPANSYTDASVTLGDIPVKITAANTEPPFSVSFYPNPFNPVLTLRISLQDNMDIEISTYNIKGELLQRFPSRSYEKGMHALSWDAEAYPSGLYFIMIEAMNDTKYFQVGEKCLLLK